MQVGLAGSLPSFALTSTDEAKSVAAARLPDSSSITFPTLEQTETAQGSGTDERLEANVRKQPQTDTAENADTETAQAEQQAQTQARVEQRRARELEQAEAEEIQALAKRDREVRVHEQAHQSVGGAYSGNASFTFVAGPNGVRYAISGEVSIDMSKVPGNPQATLQKANIVQRAALAPRDPSSQDRQVAAQAVRLALEARSEIQQQRSSQVDAERTTDSDETSTNDAVSASTDEAGLSASQTDAEGSRFGDEDDDASTPLAEATARLIELNEDLSRIYEKLIEAQNFEQASSISQLLDIDA